MNRKNISDVVPFSVHNFEINIISALSNDDNDTPLSKIKKYKKIDSKMQEQPCYWIGFFCYLKKFTELHV